MYGTGIRYKGSSIPLATGSHAHKACEYILKAHMSHGEIPTSDEVRDAIEVANDAYREEIHNVGFVEDMDEDRVVYTLEEQTTLISGLIWSWASYILPVFLENYEVLHVEQEMEKIVDCACGLSGIGVVAAHVERDCNGVCIMTRPDVVVRDRLTNAVYYVELKTGGKIDAGTFEGDVQFAFGAAGVEGFTGLELTGSYVHGLIKGYRKRPYGQDAGPKHQASSLCYAYVLPAMDGLVPENIKFKYGKGVSKQHRKTAVWEMDFKDKHPDIPNIEHYISLMDDEELESHVRVFGPYPYPKQQVEEMLVEIAYLEKRNHEVYTYVNQEVEERGFAHEETQNSLREFVPKSWGCRQWGEQLCQYYPICMRQHGWDQPCKYMDYEKREANHPIEFEV